MYHGLYTLRQLKLNHHDKCLLKKIFGWNGTLEQLYFETFMEMGVPMLNFLFLYNI